MTVLNSENDENFVVIGRLLQYLDSIDCTVLLQHFLCLYRRGVQMAPFCSDLDGSILFRPRVTCRHNIVAVCTAGIIGQLSEMTDGSWATEEY